MKETVFFAYDFTLNGKDSNGKNRNTKLFDNSHSNRKREKSMT